MRLVHEQPEQILRLPIPLNYHTPIKSVSRNPLLDYVLGALALFILFGGPVLLFFFLLAR